MEGFFFPQREEKILVLDTFIKYSYQFGASIGWVFDCGTLIRFGHKKKNLKELLKYGV
jgi:hypothetical protein